jgi:hypothetical protein
METREDIDFRINKEVAGPFCFLMLLLWLVDEILYGGKTTSAGLE